MIILNKICRYIVLACLAIGPMAKAQDEYKDVDKIIMPSPTAYQFSVYGNNPVNGSSGGFNYSVPIYTIESGDIKLPISADYFSNGVMVDKLSGILGMDWNLNAGGVISRVIKDFPDESGYRWYPSTIDTSNDEVMFKNLARESSFDGEQDWFSFNVNGISGNFYFDENLVPHISSESNVKITFESVYTPSPFDKFTIIDDKGFKYIFGGSANYIETNLNAEECSFPNSESRTAWFLNEIISPRNNSITFQYVSNNFVYKTDHSFFINMQQICPSPNDPNGNDLEGHLPYSVNICTNYDDIKSKAISSINFNTLVENNVITYKHSVNFEYDSQRLDGGGLSLKNIKIKDNNVLIKQIDFVYDVVNALNVPINSALTSDTTLKYRQFLKDIICKGNLLSTNWEKYSFEYFSPNLIPIRLSYSKDKFGYPNASNNTYPFSSIHSDYSHWDYIDIANVESYCTANRAINTSTVYYGTLKKITYPTGGTTLVNYEANKDIVPEVIAVPSTGTITVYKPWCSTPLVSQEYSFVSNGMPFNYKANIFAIGAGCTTGSYTLKIYKDGVLLYGLYNNSYGTVIETDPLKPCVSTFTSYFFNEEPICTVAGSTYKILVTTEGGSASGSVNIFYNAVDTNVDTVIYGAGVRVKDITDLTEGQNYNTRKFFYNKLVEFPSDKSLMAHAYKPLFDELTFPVVWCSNVACDPETSQTACCLYYGPEYDFINYTLSTYAYNSNYLTRHAVSYPTITEIMETNGIKLGAVERIYAPSPESPAQMIIGYIIYGASPSNSGTILKDKIIEENLYDDTLITKKSKKSFHYLIFGNGYITSTVVRKKYPWPGEADFPSSPEVCTALTLQPMENYSIWIYKNHYGILRLDEITEINYLGTGNIQSTFTHSFGPGPNYLLQSTTTTNSLSESLKTEYKYASDLVGVEQTPYIQQMVDANRLAEPIITKTYNGATKLSESHAKFLNSSATGNLLLPIEVHDRKGADNINIATTADRKVQFTKYDAKGNILEYKLENDVVVSIVWGYNNSLPIAKIENAAYSSLNATLVGEAQTASNGTSESTLLTKLTTLRNSIATTSFITTYSYKPLIGISTITDPKGDKLSYSYDHLGRLKDVKDKDSRILSENEYHFRP